MVPKPSLLSFPYTIYFDSSVRWPVLGFLCYSGVHLFSPSGLRGVLGVKDYILYRLISAKRHSLECCPKQALIRHSLILLRSWKGSAKGCILLVKIYSVSSALISETYHQGPLLYSQDFLRQAKSREAMGRIYMITNCYLLGLAFT